MAVDRVILWLDLRRQRLITARIEVAVALAADLMRIRFSELAAELLTTVEQRLCPLNVLKVDALVQLPVANSAELKWVTVSLLEVVRAHHQALVVDAVRQSEHVAQFVSANLGYTH